MNPLQFIAEAHAVQPVYQQPLYYDYIANSDPIITLTAKEENTVQPETEVRNHIKM